MPTPTEPLGDGPRDPWRSLMIPALAGWRMEANRDRQGASRRGLTAKAHSAAPREPSSTSKIL